MVKTWSLVYPGEPIPDDPALADARVAVFVADLIDANTLYKEQRRRIERAHDMLQALLENRAAKVMMSATGEDWGHSFNALCWVLEHKKNKGFDHLLGLVEAVLSSVGDRTKERMEIDEAAIDERS